MPHRLPSPLAPGITNRIVNRIGPYTRLHGGAALPPAPDIPFVPPASTPDRLARTATRTGQPDPVPAVPAIPD